MDVKGGFGGGDATVDGTTGAVVRSGRLTLIVGDADDRFGADATLPTEALRTADHLAAEGTWGFDEVATALHQLVIDHDPAGVAALLDGDAEAMVFLFDQAEAVEFDPDDPTMPDELIEADGRAGWTTELVSGPFLRLALRSAEADPPDRASWSVLRSGVVPGNCAVVPVTAPAEFELELDTLPPPLAAPPLAPPPAPAPSGPGPSGPGTVGFLVEEGGGHKHALSPTTVVGSDPAGDPEVVIGAASMITVNDPSVHEVHVRIKASGQAVTVTDAGFGDAWLQSSDGPMEALDGTPRPLDSGSRLLLGSKTFAFQPASGTPASGTSS